jgi:hypothetical protein
MMIKIKKNKNKNNNIIGSTSCKTTTSNTTSHLVIFHK